MAHAHYVDGDLVEITGDFRSGVGDDAVNHPAGWLDAATADEIAAAGVLPIVDDAAPEADRLVTGRRLVERDGVAVRVYETEPAPVEEPVVPASVTPRQLRLALLGAGKLGQVQAFVDSGYAPPEAVISWEYAIEFLRSDPMLNQLAGALQPPMTGEQIDQLFVAAAQIR